MGNFNSGKRTNRQTTNDMHRLDVRKLQREGHMQVGKSVSWQWHYDDVLVSHRAQIQVFAHHINISHACNHVQSELAPTCYAIGIARTPCHMGGHRVWWHCPATGCGRRVAVLYAQSGAIFACRHCYRLNYESQRKSVYERKFLRVEKLRQRLGWQRGIANGHQGKPPRMRWHTYWRLLAEHESLERAILGTMQRRFNLATAVPG